MRVFKIIISVLLVVGLFVGGYTVGHRQKPERVNKGDFLDMETVTTFEATSEGVLLITEDGNGYYIEK